MNPGFQGCYQKNGKSQTEHRLSGKENLKRVKQISPYFSVKMPRKINAKNGQQKTPK